MNSATTNYTVAFLSGKRNTTDVAADKFISKVFADEQQKAALRNYLGELSNNQQLQSLPLAYADELLFTSASQLPAWANKKQVQQGQAFFARHAGLIMNMLGLLSLPYCYAAADGARVLYLSNRLRNDTARRLQETGDFVWEVMAPDAFEPRGRGFASILKVRLIHAIARYYTLQSGQWQAVWGLPVNQEDMAGTNLSFSLLVIRGLRKLEVAISYTDQQAFMHLWNVIGYLSGVEYSLLPQDGKQAVALEEAISKRQFRPSEQGRALTQSLIQYFTSLNLQPPFGSKETIQLMRFLLGNPVADIIGLPQGEVPRAIINLLKLSGSLQELRWMPSVNRAYRQQYASFNKQQEQVGK